MNAPGNAPQPVAGTALSLSMGGAAISGTKVYRVTGHEAISRPFRYEIELIVDGGNLSFGDVLDRDATLTIEVTDGGLTMVRKVHGVIDEFMVEESADHDDHYRMVLVPRLATLARNRQNRIHATSAPQTLEQIIEHKLLSSGPDYGPDERHERAALKAEEFRIDIDNTKVPLTSLSHVAQYDETDLDFIRRLCERHGVYFFFASNAREPAVPEDTRGMVVFANTNEPFGVIRFPTDANGGGYENEHRLDIDLTLTGTTGLTGGWTLTPFDAGASDESDDDTIARLEGVLVEFGSVRRPRPASVSVIVDRRVEFQGDAPGSDRTVDRRRTETLAGGIGAYTDYDTDIVDEGAGDKFARIRSQELRAAREYSVGCTSSPCVAPGRTFTKKPPAGSIAEDEEYLVTAVDIEVTHAHTEGMSDVDGEVIQTGVVNRFRCIEFDEAGGFVFRPPRETPVPRVPGVQTAYIGTGNKGEAGRPKLDTEGRYRIYSQFVDERARFVDPDFEGDAASEPASADELDIDSLSKAVRKGEPYAGDGVGMHFPLKRDTEVLVTYRNGDPDRPVIAAAMPGPLDHASPVTDANPTSHVIRTSSGARFEIHDDDRDADGEDSGARIALRSRAADDKASYVRLGRSDTTNESVPETLEDRYETNVAVTENEEEDETGAAALKDGVALYSADNIRDATRKDRITEAQGSVRVGARRGIYARSVQRHLLRGGPMVIVSGEEVDEPDEGYTFDMAQEEASIEKDDILLSSKGNVYITADEDIRTTVRNSVTTVEGDEITRTYGDTVSHHYGTTQGLQRGSSNSVVLGASTNVRVGLAQLGVLGGWLRPWGPLSLRVYLGIAYYLWPQAFILQGTVTLTTLAFDYKCAGAIVERTNLSCKKSLVRHRLTTTNVESAANVSILGIKHTIL